jgi:hypothetical protein
MVRAARDVASNQSFALEDMTCGLYCAACRRERPGDLQCESNQ